jgi:NADH-quinone oxidoreductase subunit G
MNRGDRIEAPLVADGERHTATDWDTALDALASLIDRSLTVALLASGRASVESLGLVRRLVEGKQLTAAVRVPMGEVAPLPGVPDLALRAERVPNLHGAELLGYGRDWSGALSAAASADLVIVLDVDLDADEEAALAAIPGRLAVLGTTLSDLHRRAEVVLPVTTMAEENGVYVNRDLRAQRYHQARAPRAMARPAWWIAGEVLAGQGPDADAPSTAGEAFRMIAGTVAAFAGLGHEDLGFSGRPLRGRVTAEAAR